jgi:hypothetical protein
VDPLRVLAYSVDVCLYGKSFLDIFYSSYIFVVVSVSRDACFRVPFRILILYTGGAWAGLSWQSLMPYQSSLIIKTARSHEQLRIRRSKV